MTTTAQPVLHGLAWFAGTTTNIIEGIRYILCKIFSVKAQEKEDDISNLRHNQNAERNPEKGHSSGIIICDQHQDISVNVDNRDEDRQYIVKDAEE